MYFDIHSQAGCKI